MTISETVILFILIIAVMGAIGQTWALLPLRAGAVGGAFKGPRPERAPLPHDRRLDQMINEYRDVDMPHISSLLRRANDHLPAITADVRAYLDAQSRKK